MPASRDVRQRRPDSPLGNALDPQHLVKRNRLTGKPAHDQILGEHAQHGRTLDRLPLHLGDFVSEAGLKLGGDCPRPLRRAGATVKVPSRQQPRLGATFAAELTTISACISILTDPIFDAVYEGILDLGYRAFQAP